MKNLVVHNHDLESQFRTAAFNGDIKCLKKLAKKIDINATSASGNNALHYASFSRDDNLKIIEFLVNIGVDFSQQNDSGRTPVQVAKINGNKRIDKYLNQICKKGKKVLNSKLMNLIIASHFVGSNYYFKRH